MSEWWSYRPADLLMFAPRTYWRLFELHNAAWWPLQVVVVLAGLMWVARLSRRPAPALRAGAAGLATAWAFVAWAFLLQRYAPINWAASAFAFGFVAQAFALALLAMRGDLNLSPHRGRCRVGLLLWISALAGYPLLAPAFGQPWSQAEVFALAPDPTAIATLGHLLLVAASSRATRVLLRVLWVLPLLWCAISATTLWTMGSWQAAAPLSAALLAALVAAGSRHVSIGPRWR